MAVPLVFLTVFDTTSPVWAAAGTVLGGTHRHLTSPFTRAAVLAMSGTRRVYHYPPVQVIAMRLARTHSRQERTCLHLWNVGWRKIFLLGKSGFSPEYQNRYFKKNWHSTAEKYPPDSVLEDAEQVLQSLRSGIQSSGNFLKTFYIPRCN